MINDQLTGQPQGSAGAMRSALAGTDRIFPEIRVIAAFIVLVLIIASAILYLMPDRTADFFAWTIKPNMTPLLMGAGYLSGAWFFIGALRAKGWHEITRGFFPITAFTWFMGLATVLHWDRFNHNHVSFYAWTILYIITPFLVPALWFRNRVTDPGTLGAGDIAVPERIRLAATVVGAGMLVIALFLFVVPDVAISIWPWQLTALTARVVAGWFALPGVVGLVLGREARWSAWRILIQSQLIALALILVAVVRAWGDFKTANPLTWVFIAGITGLLAAATALYFAMDARRPNPAA
jgi:hypothetical protein